MKRLNPGTIGLAVILLIMMSMLYFGWSLPHGWVFGAICAGTSEPYEQFLVVDSNFKAAELRAEEYARANSECTQTMEVRFLRDRGRIPYRVFGVKQIDE